jgi:hypothetical protein
VEAKGGTSDPFPKSIINKKQGCRNRQPCFRLFQAVEPEFLYHEFILMQVIAGACDNFFHRIDIFTPVFV